MSNIYGKYLLPLLMLLILLPLLIKLSPFLVFSPDIEYVKAKVLRVLEGELYADPITGFPTFHPPYYHLFLAGLKTLGPSLNHILVGVTVSNVALLLLFVWRIIRRQFNERTAFFTCLLLPFIIEFMGCGNIFLATAFYFSLPFYLAGLEQYLWPERTTARTIACGILWGLAFLISPGYLFLIGLAVAAELLVHRRYRQSLVLIGTLAAMLIPFFVQAYQIFAQSLFGTGAFSFWRGFPDFELLTTLGRYLVSPFGRSIGDIRVWIGAGVAVFGLWGMIRTRRDNSLGPIRGFVAVAAAAYLFTFYHYLPQYAIRVHLFFSIIVTAFAIHTLFLMNLRRFIRPAILVILAVFGMSNHFNYSLYHFNKQNARMIKFDQARAGICEQLGDYIEPDQYLLATAHTYRHFVMPHFPVHCLAAYRSGEYYQLTSAVSDRLQIDYTRLMDCNNLECLDSYCRRYRISTALIRNGPEFKIAAFQQIARHWEQVYGDDDFRIYRKP
ncbi:MAG: hypothetical protein GY841_17810 [FCB group bacterium]|nr:hypothetical protein [FCB group bacterium]